MTYGLAYALAIPRSATDPAAAVRTAFALADPSQAPITASELSMAPALRSALVSPLVADRFASVFVPQALVAQGWLSPDPAETDRVLGAMIDDIMSGRKAIGDALTTADRALDAALAL
jgi:ABC-type glycerol-3-phosphate transport system substrate-binding protein